MLCFHSWQNIVESGIECYIWIFKSESSENFQIQLWVISDCGDVSLLSLLYLTYWCTIVTQVHSFLSVSSVIRLLLNSRLNPTASHYTNSKNLMLTKTGSVINSLNFLNVSLKIEQILIPVLVNTKWRSIQWLYNLFAL